MGRHVAHWNKCCCKRSVIVVVLDSLIIGIISLLYSQAAKNFNKLLLALLTFLVPPWCLIAANHLYQVGNIEGDTPSADQLHCASSNTLQDIASGEELSLYSPTPNMLVTTDGSSCINR
ncbi:hypothetical protein MKX01_028909 [Papaver californicum]|nr:hypothetical protein MKX01_028909 [Papaver californicum]